MAIPMSLPAEEDSELDHLLHYISIALQQIIRLRQHQRMRSRYRYIRRQDPRPPPNGPIPAPMNAPNVPMEPRIAANLPEEVPAAAEEDIDGEIPGGPLNLPSRLPQPADSATAIPDLLTDITDCRTRKLTTTTTWTQTGNDLRQIADAFVQLRNPDETKRIGNQPEGIKDCNQLSKLCPMLVNTLWPMLAFVIGLNYLSRTR